VTCNAAQKNSASTASKQKTQDPAAPQQQQQGSVEAALQQQLCKDYRKQHRKIKVVHPSAVVLLPPAATSC
jgi:hypothetical protein